MNDENHMEKEHVLRERVGKHMALQQKALLRWGKDMDGWMGSLLLLLLDRQVTQHPAVHFLFLILFLFLPSSCPSFPS